MDQRRAQAAAGRAGSASGAVAHSHRVLPALQDQEDRRERCPAGSHRAGAEGLEARGVAGSPEDLAAAGGPAAKRDAHLGALST